MNVAASRQDIPARAFARALWLRVALGLLIVLAGPASAQPGATDADPPARAGRVSEVIGDAWLFDVEAKDWVRVGRNQTIAQGDRLRTDERARVSLRIGSTSLWLDERSDLEFSRLDEGSVLLQLDKGELGLRLRSSATVADYRVQTREGRLIPEREGLYRIGQLDRGSRAYAWAGRLRFESASGGDVPATWVEAGEQLEFWWAGGPRVERQRIDADGFGDWMTAQDQQDAGIATAGASQRYVSPEMTGAEELDRNGRWEQSGEFGAVWYPHNIGPDWAPYRYGHWVWTRHWGWSWVDDAPWGFAPFHYGRWLQWGGRWCWAPGAYVARPVYAPALVAWVGGGAVGVGISVGGRPAPPRYGWYPLAPREVYAPAYRHTPTYMQRLNHDHGPATVQRPRPHSNREVAGAISYLPGQGAPARPLPPINGQQSLRVLPAPPPRAELSVALPPRPAPEARPAPANMHWRSENAPGRQNRDRDRDTQRPVQTPQAPQMPQMPQAPQVQVGIQPAPAAPVASPTRVEQVGPPRPATEAPTGWRGRDRDRGNERSNERPNEREPFRPPVGAAELPSAQRQTERALERLQERSERAERGERGERGERPGRGFERQQQPPQQQAAPRPPAAVEMPAQARPPQAPPAQMQAPQQPQVQLPPPPAPAKHNEDKPVSRGRPDGNKNKGNTEVDR